MALDERFSALLRRQSVERGELFDLFLVKRPNVEIHADDWTAEQEKDWRAMASEHDAKCRQQRNALADLLDAE